MVGDAARVERVVEAVRDDVVGPQARDRGTPRRRRRCWPRGRAAVKPTATGSPVVPDVTCMRTSRSARRAQVRPERRLAPLALAQLVLRGERQRAAGRPAPRTPRAAQPLARRTGSTPRGRRAARRARSLARGSSSGGRQLERAPARCGRRPRSPRAGRPRACPPPWCARPAARTRRRSSPSGAAAPSRPRRAAGRSGSAVSLPPASADRLARERDQAVVERDRRDPTRGAAARPRSRWSAAACSQAARASASIAASASASRWRWSSSISVRPGDGRDDARLAGRAADRADAARGGCRSRGSPAPPGRSAAKRVAAQPHRRRAGVRGLAGEDDQVALDAERAEHRRRRLAAALAAPGPARCAARGRRARRRRRAPRLAARRRGRRRSARRTSSRRSPSRSRRSRTSSGVERARRTADEPNRLRPKRAPSSSAQSTSRRPTGGVPALGLRAQRLERRAARRARRRASRRPAPSRRASRRSRTPSPLARAARPRGCRPRRPSTSTGSSSSRARRNSRARDPLVGPAHAPRAVRARR